MQTILKAMPMLVVALCGATQMMAQDGGSAQDEAMHKLQARMDELHSQMLEIQSELDAMHGVNRSF